MCDCNEGKDVVEYAWTGKLGIQGPSTRTCHLNKALPESSSKGGIRRGDGASREEPFLSLIKINGIDCIELEGAYGLRITIALLFTSDSRLVELEERVIEVLGSHFGCEMKPNDIFEKARNIPGE